MHDLQRFVAGIPVGHACMSVMVICTFKITAASQSQDDEQGSMDPGLVKLKSQMEAKEALTAAALGQQVCHFA